MNILKKLAGVAAFVVALIVAILVTRYYAPRTDAPPAAPPPPPPVVSAPSLPPVEPMPPLPPKPALPPSVSYKARLVSLDFTAGKTYTTVVLEREPGATETPESVWVWTYFFDDAAARGERPAWSSDPVEIRQPFARGNRTTVTATAQCAWCADPQAPRSGYYARVNISSVSKDAARLSRERLNYDITGATPVEVQGADRKTR
jgi:hypothetical protein